MPKITQREGPQYQVRIQQLVVAQNAGQTRKDCMATFCKKWGIAERTFEDYWALAKEQSNKLRIDAKNIMIDGNKYEAEERVRRGIMQKLDIEEALSKILRGSARHIKLNADLQNGTPAIDKVVFPSDAERVSAAKELNAMQGNLAPTKVQNSHEMSEAFEKAVKEGRIIIESKTTEAQTLDSLE